MARKKKKKELPPFDYKKYIDEEIKDKAFLYYILSNNIILKDEKDVKGLYKKFLDNKLC